MKIVFYGASVTHQSGDSGYTSHVFDFLNKNNILFEKISYPACHFNDAGYFFSKSIVDSVSDYVVFEWNTTGMSQFDDDKFKAVIYSFIRANITPCFLILPRINTTIINGEVYTRISEKQIIEFASENSFPLLDLRGINDLSQLLKDEVHTNDLGARVYGDLIVDWINGFINKKYSLKSIEFTLPFKESSVSLLDYGINFFEFFRIKLVKTGYLPEIGITGLVGPYSPVVSIKINNSPISNFSFFDPWCYYQRRMTISMINKDSLGKYVDGELLEILIEVLEVPPNYAISNSTNFSIPDKKFVNLETLIICDFDPNSFDVDYL